MRKNWGFPRKISWNGLSWFFHIYLSLPLDHHIDWDIMMNIMG
jgi:hypothetical protein